MRSNLLQRPTEDYSGNCAKNRRNLRQKIRRRNKLREKEILVREFLRENNFEKIRSLLGSLTRSDCKIVVTKSLQGKKLLYLAIKSRNRNLVSFLVECGADVNERLLSKDKSPVLMTAIKNGDFDLAFTLDKLQVNLEAKDRNDYNAIVYAVQKRQLTLARYLRYRNVNINSSVSVLNCSKDLYYLEQALKLDYDVKHLGIYKNNVFILAASWGHMDIIKRLLEYDINIYYRNFRGFNALCEAFSHKRYEVVEFLIAEVYSVYDYIEALEFTGASDMIFSNDFAASYSSWKMALKLRNLYDYPRQMNPQFRATIGIAYVSLDKLETMGSDCFRLLLQALLVYLRILPRHHQYVHDALATVASKDYLLDEYETTIKLLEQLFMFHQIDAQNVTKTAGYKALKIGLVILERTVEMDVTGSVEQTYYKRFKMVFNFITTNVWGLLCCCEKTNLTYYSCYKKYLILLLDLISLMYCADIVVDQEPLYTQLLTILVRKQMPYHPLSCLHVAVKRKYGFVIVKLLVQCGVCVSFKDIDGNTALDFAYDYTDREKNKNKIIQHLINAGADVKTVKRPRYRSPKPRGRHWCIIQPGEIVKQFEKTKNLICEALNRK